MLVVRMRVCEREVVRRRRVAPLAARIYGAWATRLPATARTGQRAWRSTRSVVLPRRHAKALMAGRGHQRVSECQLARDREVGLMQDRPDHRGADVEGFSTLDRLLSGGSRRRIWRGATTCHPLGARVAVVPSSSRPEAAGIVTVTCWPRASGLAILLTPIGIASCCLTGREAMDCGLQRVIDRFPELAASIRDCFDVDQSFREMCGDYAETLEALQRWQASDSPQRARSHRGVSRACWSAGDRDRRRAATSFPGATMR